LINKSLFNGVEETLSNMFIFTVVIIYILFYSIYLSIKRKGNICKCTQPHICLLFLEFMQTLSSEKKILLVYISGMRLGRPLRQGCLNTIVVIMI